MDATTIPTNLQEKAQEIKVRSPPTVDGIDSCAAPPDQTQPPPVMKTKSTALQEFHLL